MLKHSSWGLEAQSQSCAGTQEPNGYFPYGGRRRLTMGSPDRAVAICPSGSAPDARSFPASGTTPAPSVRTLAEGPQQERVAEAVEKDSAIPAGQGHTPRRLEARVLRESDHLAHVASCKDFLGHAEEDASLCVDRLLAVVRGDDKGSARTQDPADASA